MQLAARLAGSWGLADKGLKCSRSACSLPLVGQTKAAATVAMLVAFVLRLGPTQPTILRPHLPHNTAHPTPNRTRATQIYFPLQEDNVFECERPCNNYWPKLVRAMRRYASPTRNKDLANVTGAPPGSNPRWLSVDRFCCCCLAGFKGVLTASRPRMFSLP